MSLKRVQKALTNADGSAINEKDGKFATDSILVMRVKPGRFNHYYTRESDGSKKRYYPTTDEKGNVVGALPEDVEIVPTVCVLYKNLIQDASGKSIPENNVIYAAYAEANAIKNPITAPSINGYIAIVDSVINVLEKDNEVTNKKAGEEQLTILSLEYTTDNNVVIQQMLNQRY